MTTIHGNSGIKLVAKTFPNFSRKRHTERGRHADTYEIYVRWRHSYIASNKYQGC